MIKTIRLLSSMDDKWVRAQTGKYLTKSHFDPDKLISKQSADVVKPDGSPLLLFRSQALPFDVCELARSALRSAGASYSVHRGYHSRIVGNYQEAGMCRKTSFTARELEHWLEIVPFVRACDAVFRRELRSRYRVQRQWANATNPDWLIADTVFTTTTVNLWDDTHDAQTPVHQDDGDLAEGFGVISVLSAGSYSGAELVFPKYGVAVDLRTSDVLLCDVHEFHGNAPVVRKSSDWERIATVHYYRTDMRDCSK